MWELAVWTALVLGALVGIAAFSLLVSRSLKALRAFKETHRVIVGGLAEFAAKAEAAADTVVPHK